MTFEKSALAMMTVLAVAGQAHAQSNEDLGSDVPKRSFARTETTN